MVMPEGQFTQEDMVPKLVDLLGDKDWIIRHAAVVALGMIGDPRAIEPLAMATKDENLYVRMAAILVLGVIGGITGDARTVDALIEVLRSKERFTAMQLLTTPAINYYEAVTEALAMTGSLAARPLIALLRDIDSEIRQRAELALLKIGAEAIEPLIEALRDSDATFRERVVQVLLKIGKEAVKPLVEALKDENASVRIAAAKVLGEKGDSTMVDPLIAALVDENADVRKAVAEAIWKIIVRERQEGVKFPPRSRSGPVSF